MVFNTGNILGYGGSQSGARAMVYKAGIEPMWESQSVVSGRLSSGVLLAASAIADLPTISVSNPVPMWESQSVVSGRMSSSASASC